MEDLILSEINMFEFRITALTNKGQSVLNSLRSNHWNRKETVFSKSKFEEEMKYRKAIGDSIKYIINIKEQE